MPTTTPKRLATADRSAMKAWNTEIAAEQAEERGLRDQALEDERLAAAKRAAELAAASTRTLKAAGLTAAAAKKRADDEFARARQAGAAQHARARATLRKRAQAHAAEVKTMLANLQSKE